METNSDRSVNTGPENGKGEYKGSEKHYLLQATVPNTSAEKTIEIRQEESNWVPASERKSEFTGKASISVFDVAQYILKKKGKVSTMKLQKLVYYCQAWSLVWDEEPLFSEAIEAWANGPVVRELFNCHRRLFSVDSIPNGNPDLLSSAQKETIGAVIEFYGDKPAQWLIDLAHSEEPWRKARVGISDLERGNRTISLDSMQEYYSSLLNE